MTHHQQQQPQGALGGDNGGGGGSFDPYSWETFFYGPLDRREAERLLDGKEIGTFLLRESTSKPGYSLTVKDADNQIYNYLIERTPQPEDGKLRYTISNLSFCDIPSLLSYFKLCKLERTTLLRPLERQPLGKVIGRFKFEGERVSDLPFERGEILDILDKPEERWWMARNCLGNMGLVPVNYIKVYEEGDEISLQNPSTKSSASSGDKRFSANSTNEQLQMQMNGGGEIGSAKFQSNSWVRVLADRWPSIYDMAALNIRQGQFLWLHEVLSNGMCRGVNEEGKSGLFPITYVEPINMELPPWNPTPGDA